MPANLTVAIVTRNRHQSLKRVLLSLAKQSVKPVEVLIIDNNSSDPTRKVVCSFNDSLPLRYILEKQIGIPAARNRALKEVKTIWLSFIDDDCEAPRKWIEYIIISTKTHPRAAAITGLNTCLPVDNPYSILAEFNNQVTYFYYNLIAKPQIKNDFYRKNYLVAVLDTKNVAFNMPIIKKLGLVFDKNFSRGSDYDFARQIISNGKDIWFCPQVVMQHWERDSLYAFLKTRFATGIVYVKLNKKWPRISTPNDYYGIRKLKDFCSFCLAKNITKEIPYLLIIFILDKLFSLFGRFYTVILDIYRTTKGKN